MSEKDDLNNWFAAGIRAARGRTFNETFYPGAARPQAQQPAGQLAQAQTEALLAAKALAGPGAANLTEEDRAHLRGLVDAGLKAEQPAGRAPLPPGNAGAGVAGALPPAGPPDMNQLIVKAARGR